MKKVPIECKIADNLSVDQFQEQLFSIFEEKGILKDVRAFLRTQMINVVRGMETGNVTISPQRHMQRMNISNQVMNILISEYLLQQHFTYTLSMFTSEIPLADMEFDFAKRLFSVATVSVDNKLRKYDVIHFREHDVRDILNILGFPNDSPMKADIIKMYKQERRQPLLICIITTLVNDLKEYSECMTASEDSIGKTSKDGSAYHKYARITNNESEIHWKDKYDRKIQKLNVAYGEELTLKLKKAKVRFKLDQRKLELSMQNEATRREEQLKNEIEQVKEDCSRQIKTIEQNVNRKKKFLWNMFKSIQEQIVTIKKARDNVKKEEHRIKAKTKELELKVTEGEAMLSNKGEQLNQKIKQEMFYLEDKMQNFEREKRALSHERQSLNNLQSLLESERAALDTNKKRAVSESESSHRYNKQLQEHCETLKLQLDTFNRINMRSEDKSIFIERSTQTDIPDPYQTCLNNVPEIAADRVSCHPSVSDCRDMKQTVVNNLKKWKNVNMTNDLEVQTDVCGVARPETGVGVAETAGLMCQVLEHTQEDNRNLRSFLDLQKSQIQELIAQKASLQSELATANLTLNNFMRMKVANERILAATPRLLRPPEVPTGADEEERVTCSNPIKMNRKPADKSEKKFNKSPESSNCRIQMQQSLDERRNIQADHSELLNIDKTRSAKQKAKQPHCPSTTVDHFARLRGHKTRIKETAQGQNGDELERFRTDSLAGLTDDRERYVDTDKTVNAVRRRFRKLEIEAEAVNKAYHQFKTRHSDSTLSYGRYSSTNVATVGTALGKGEFTNLRSFTSDILSSQYPEYIKPLEKKSNVKEIDSFKSITGLLDEPLMDFRRMYIPASIKSKSQSEVINDRVKYDTQALEKSVKDCAISPIFSIISKVESKIPSSNKEDYVSDINQAIRVNENETSETNLHNSFNGQNATSAIRDHVNNINIEILPVTIENFENFEKYLGKQNHAVETYFEGNVNIVTSNDSIIDKAIKEKYLSSDIPLGKLDINISKNSTCEKELKEANSSLTEKFVVPKQRDKSNTEPKKCGCRKSDDCVCIDLKGFSINKINDEAKISKNGAIVVSVESSVLKNDSVLLESNPRLDIETVNLEENVISITVEETYTNEGMMTQEENLLLDNNLNVEVNHIENTNYVSVPIELVADTQSPEYKEDFNKSENVKKENSFLSILKHTDNTNCDSVPIESIIDLEDPTYKEDFNKSEIAKIENSFHTIPKHIEVIHETPKSKEIEDQRISYSEGDDNSEFSVAEDVESVGSDLSVHKASSGDDSFWSK